METQEVADFLMQNGYAADALHGDLSQAQRDTVMKKFRLKNIDILVATDVAARGLDVNSLTHVIHFLYRMILKYSFTEAEEQVEQEKTVFLWL
jgi:ATP-dependent RNA helicase DeaD